MRFFCFLITVLMVVLVPLSLIAQDIKPLEIKPVPDLPSDYGVTLARSIGEHDGSGIIDAVYEGRIVINDQDFSLTENVQITNIRGGTVNLFRLTPGIKAYYFLESAGKIKALVLNN